MVKDAELHKEEDARRKAVVEAKNQAESLAHQTKKNLEEHKANLEPSEVEKIQKALSDLEATLKNENANKEEVEAKMKALAESSSKAHRGGDAKGTKPPSI